MKKTDENSDYNDLDENIIFLLLYFFLLNWMTFIYISHFFVYHHNKTIQLFCYYALFNFAFPNSSIKKNCRYLRNISRIWKFESNCFAKVLIAIVYFLSCLKALWGKRETLHHIADTPTRASFAFAPARMTRFHVVRERVYRSSSTPLVKLSRARITM